MAKNVRKAGALVKVTEGRHKGEKGIVLSSRGADVKILTVDGVTLTVDSTDLEAM